MILFDSVSTETNLIPFAWSLERRNAAMLFALQWQIFHGAAYFAPNFLPGFVLSSSSSLQFSEAALSAIFCILSCFFRALSRTSLIPPSFLVRLFWRETRNLQKTGKFWAAIPDSILETGKRATQLGGILKLQHKHLSNSNERLLLEVLELVLFLAAPDSIFVFEWRPPLYDNGKDVHDDDDDDDDDDGGYTMAMVITRR